MEYKFELNKLQKKSKLKDTNVFIDCAGDNISMEEIEELMDDADGPPSNEELMVLSHELDAEGQHRTPPRVLENQDDYVYTSDSTLLRMQRYSDQNSSSSNDPEYYEEMTADTYFTGSEETSGGEHLDCDLTEEETEGEL